MFISWLMRLVAPLMPVPRPRGRHARTGRRTHTPPSLPALPAPTATRSHPIPEPAPRPAEPPPDAAPPAPSPSPPHSRRVVGPWYVAWERRQSPVAPVSSDPLDTLRAELAPLVRELVTARAETVR